MIQRWRDLGRTRATAVIAFSLFIIALGAFVYWYIPVGRMSYVASHEGGAATTTATTTPVFIVTHIETPHQVKAVYLGSWAAGNDKFREELFDLASTTELNAVVIDVKDYTGRISFPVDDPYLKSVGSAQARIPDIERFIGKLHEMGVYVIGRISTFQDSFLVNIHPEWAVMSKNGGVWQDFKGVKWLDPGATPVWEYLSSIGRQAYAYGFDELNFDYIRYPSDGDLGTIVYAWSDGRPRTEVLHDFFLYTRTQFSGTSTVPLSVDLFGMTTVAEGDLGIGQVLDDALTYFDYVSPMVYPSHFGYGFDGIVKPATEPYEVVKYSMGSAVSRALAASTSPSKLRPWLQAFDLGAIYTPAMVRAQIQATYDVGLDSWMLWNAASVYKKDALMPKSPTAIAR